MKSWVEKQKEEKNGFIRGFSLLSVSDIITDTYLTFNPHHYLARQMLITPYLLMFKVMEQGVELRFKLKVFHCATCLLYFLLVKNAPRCKLTDVRPDFVFSPLCLSQSLASSLTLRNAKLRSMVGTE